jgi:hypothetical protein
MKGDPMRAYQRLILLTSLCATTQGFAKFEAHEWGTFTSLVGSNGLTQNGMYHEDEVLPDFVHGFGVTRNERLFSNVTGLLMNEVSPPTTQPPPPPPPPPPKCRGKGCFLDEAVFQRNVITQKMETPVIYFYSDREQKVQVDVSFPEGVITETFPAPVQTSPSLQDDLIIANGKTRFSVKVLPQFEGQVPAVESGNIYSHARKVKSNIVRSGNEEEKFIFYRGLGRFQPAISMRASAGALTLKANASSLPQAAFLVHVDETGDGQMLALGNLRANYENLISAETIARLSTHGERTPGDSILRSEKSRQALLLALQKAGLYADEALSMLNTWEHGYLKVPGLRMLYILPRAEVDQVLPLSMIPAPDKLERVFVGRIEILLDTQENQILKAIQSEGPRFQVQSLGRFAEPILRRIQELAPAANAGLVSSLIDKAAAEDIGTAVH